MILYCDITDFRSLADKMYVIKVWRLEFVKSKKDKQYNGQREKDKTRQKYAKHTKHRKLTIKQHESNKKRE